MSRALEELHCPNEPVGRNFNFFFRARENVSRCLAAGPKKSGIGYVLSELDGFAVAWLTPIGQNRYVWRVGARGRIRIPKIFRARENVSRCIAAGPKKSGIGYVLSELDDFAVA